MRVLKRDMRSGRIKVKVDSENDLWTLYSIIMPGNRVHGIGLRRMDSASDKIRAEKAEKRRMYLGITVEKVEYHEFSNYLRILGVIYEGPQDHGQHHTINVDIGYELEIEKDRWPEYHLDLLSRAEKNTNNPNILILSVEDDNIVLAVMYPYGLKEVSHVEASGLKGLSSGGRHEMFREAAHRAVGILQENMPLLVVGAGFIKEDFIKFCRDNGKYREAFSGAVLENTGAGGMGGAREAISSGVASKLIKGFQADRESKYLDLLLREISRGKGLAAYGCSEVKKALDAGAAEIILATNTYLKGILASDPSELTHMETLARNCRAEMIVFSSVSQWGQVLDGLGGVGAILRFPIQ